MNKATRKAKWKTTLTPANWKVVLRISGREASFLDPDTGAVLLENEIKCIKEDNRLILGAGGLLVTIITPLQSQQRGTADSVRVRDVVQDIIDKRGVELDLGRADVETVARQFTNRKENELAKIELHRCRIKCEFLDAFNGREILPPLVSDEIRNVKQRDIGALELHDMSDPHASCTRGMFKILVSLMFKASTIRMKKKESGADQESPIRAVFVLTTNNAEVRHADAVYTGFNQITECSVHDSTLAFIVPEQDPTVIEEIRRNGDALQVALFRSHDKKYSNNKVPFVYLPCNYDDFGYGTACAFCMVRNASSPAMSGTDFAIGKLREDRRACRHKRRRTLIDLEPASKHRSTPSSPSGDSGFSSSPVWSMNDSPGAAVAWGGPCSLSDESRASFSSSSYDTPALAVEQVYGETNEMRDLSNVMPLEYGTGNGYIGDEAGGQALHDIRMADFADMFAVACDGKLKKKYKDGNFEKASLEKFTPYASLKKGEHPPPYEDLMKSKKKYTKLPSDQLDDDGDDKAIPTSKAWTTLSRAKKSWKAKCACWRWFWSLSAGVVCSLATRATLWALN